MCLGEWREEAEGQKEVGDATGVGRGNVVLDEVAIHSTLAGNGASDEARVVCDRSTSVGDLHGTTVGDGLKQPQEGDLMRGKTRVGWRRASNLGDVDRSPGESREDKALGEMPMTCEAQELGFRARHGGNCELNQAL